MMERADENQEDPVPSTAGARARKEFVAFLEGEAGKWSKAVQLSGATAN